MLSPDPQATIRLISQCRDWFAAFPFVSRIIVFGSHARNEADRWSDLDLIVVTANRLQFWDVFNCLQAQKSILHRSPFTPRLDTLGGNVLGIVFEDESVFHNLDLNFLTLNEYHTAGALNRFGLLKDLYVNSEVMPLEDQDPVQSEPLHPTELRMSGAIHFTKKAAKQVLRGTGSRLQLKERLDHLKTVMQHYPDEVIVPGGDMGKLARIYIQIAEMVLSSD